MLAYVKAARGNDKLLKDSLDHERLYFLTLF